jgi:hypothetical protein
VQPQLFNINPVGEIPVELAQQGGHSEVVDTMLHAMERFPRPFRPALPDFDAAGVHDHKQVQFEM